MDPKSLATHGVSGATLVVGLWIASTHGVQVPHYVVAAMGTLLAAVGHVCVTAFNAYTAKAPAAAPSGVLVQALQAAQGAPATQEPTHA
jgi:hypothetical protein